ncbi:MAG: aminotransferase class III-fold pyridoxal phosphate-dependent enzyme [Acutalibacteraceae bacterium]|nr:aminotransferase class III-fold pyridoxal phosphate-dependent enzyme [Acutalibacteraceae bacterium]
MSKYPEYSHNKSREWFDRALNVIPSGIYGHLGPSEGLFLPLTKWPLISSKAEGTYFWDMDGNKYLDLMCAYGPNVLGYNDPEVDAAALEQLKKGNCTTAPSYKMIECAELLVDTVDTADWAYFMKNGTDATTFAVLCARAFTHKKKVVFFKGYYHGNDPWAMKADYPGILPEDVANNIIVPWFDMEALEQAWEETGGDIAALIAQPYDHGNFYDNVCSTPEKWQAVRKFCDEHGIILIFDDVRTGFRLDLAGSDRYYGIKADIICFCKALANGYNMSAACGREFLKAAASSLSFTGSYWMSAVPFAACIACINKMKQLDTPTLFREKGEKLTNAFKRRRRKTALTLWFRGSPRCFI